MADNTVLNTNATTGDTIATDDIGGIKYQRVKIVEGADGFDDGDVSSANPLPVEVKTALPAGTNAIGKLAANSGVDIGDVDVTSLPALPAGTNAIGKLAANSGVDIGDVDVTSIIPGTAATSLGKATDSAAGATDTGMASLAVRDDSLTTLTPADGDYTHLRVNSTGALHVTGGGGGTEYTDDTSTHATGSTAGGVIMAAATPTDTSVDANDIGTVAMSVDRRLHVEETNSAAIKTAVELIDNTIDGTEMQVDVVTMPTVTETNSAAIKTAVELIDNAIDGTEMQVDVVGPLPAGTNAIGKLAANSGVDIGDVDVTSLPALPTGTNAIGKLAANSGVDIGDVDVTSVIPGTAATNAGKAVDSAAGATDTGIASLAIRDDSLSTLTPADGDYTHLRVNATGALHVTGGGGGTEYTDDTSTHSSGSTAGGVIMAAATPTDTAVTANDIGTVAMSLDRRLHVDAQIAGQDADVTIADGGNVISVDDGGGTLTVDVGTALPAGTNAIGKLAANSGVDIGDVDVTSLPSLPAGTNAIGKLAANSGVDIGDVDVTSLPSLPAGTNAIGKLAANSGVDIGDVDVSSVIAGTGATNLGKAIDSAAGGTDTGVAILAVRDDEQAAITPADGDYTAIRCDRFGNIKTTQLPDATSVVKFAAIDAASSGDNTIQAAAGAGIKIRVLSAFLVAAGTVNVRFESGAGGTALTGQMNLVANSGFTLPYNPAGWFETADNTLLNLELSAAVSVDGCVSYVEV